MPATGDSPGSRRWGVETYNAFQAFRDAANRLDKVIAKVEHPDLDGDDVEFLLWLGEHHNERRPAQELPSDELGALPYGLIRPRATWSRGPASPRALSPTG